ncbi:sugar ABC transporter substrate-binding protein [Microbacterium sp.]|uniref:sugar ABC transporter substrate-binding protein n=1 Tax=Microbacterium sp. TaxID=51671 RepID=UPI0028125019|nr:extracellular solute-binding protein [Microbacterium sp.]
MHTLTPRRRKAITAGVALAASASLLLTGCGRGDDSSGPAADGPKIDDKPATGTVELWTQGADGAKLPEMFDEFQKENPDVEINMTEVPGEEFASKMTAAITAGTVPDLVYIFTENQAGLLATGGFDPVPEGLVDEDDFFEAIWQNSVVDDVAYGVPWYSYANMLIYRKDIAEQAGVEAPTNWEEQREFGEALKAQGVEFPFALAVNYDQYTAGQVQVMAAQNGGSMISEDLSEWTINDPKVVEALEYWASLVKDGLASPDGPQFLDTVPWSSEGKNAAIVDGGPWFASWFDDANGAGWGAEHLAFAPNPVGPSGDSASTTGGGSWFVPSDGENKDAAWKFARFMSEPSSQVKWYQIFKNMPAVKAAWEEPEMQGDPLLEAVRESLEVGVGQPNVPTWAQVGAVIGQQIERVVRDDVSAKDALDEAQKQAEAIGTGAE